MGNRWCLSARATGASYLWLRPLGSLTSTPLAGTEGAAFPFWSPDSRVVAFFAGEKLKKVTLEGGSPIVLCDVIAGRGGSWSRDNVIIFASLRTDGLRRVSSAGGAPVAVTSLASGEDAHRWPFFLPDGRHFLFTAISGPCCPPAQPSVVKIASLDASASTQTLIRMESAVGYAAGHVFYGRDGTVFAQPFDVGTHALIGEAVPIAEHVGWEGSRYVSASMSTSGTLVVSEGGAPGLQQMTWYDRAGPFSAHWSIRLVRHVGVVARRTPRRCLDAKRPGLLNLDIYVVDVTSGNSTD